jgi:hypothetical protein
VSKSPSGGGGGGSKRQRRSKGGGGGGHNSEYETEEEDEDAFLASVGHGEVRHCYAAQLAAMLQMKSQWVETQCRVGLWVQA